MAPCLLLNIFGHKFCKKKKKKIVAGKCMIQPLTKKQLKCYHYATQENLISHDHQQNQH